MSPGLSSPANGERPTRATRLLCRPGLKGYWKFFGRVDLGSTWFFHAPVPPDTTKDNFDFAGYLHSEVDKWTDVVKKANIKFD